MRQFAFGLQQVADFPAQAIGPDHLVGARRREFCSHQKLACVHDVATTKNIGGAEMRRHFRYITRAAAEHIGRQARNHFQVRRL